MNMSSHYHAFVHTALVCFVLIFRSSIILQWTQILNATKVNLTANVAKNILQWIEVSHQGVSELQGVR